MADIPPWLIPADPAAYKAKGLGLGLEASSQRAAQAFREAQAAREQQMEEQRKQVQQAQWQQEYGLQQAAQQQSAQAAAAKFAAQKQYQDAVTGGMDPLQAILQFGPAMGQQASPEAAAIRSMQRKPAQTPLWVPGNDKTGEPGHWLEAGRVQQAQKPASTFEDWQQKQDYLAKNREQAAAKSEENRRARESRQARRSELKTEHAELVKEGFLGIDPNTSKNENTKKAAMQAQSRAMAIQRELRELDASDAGQSETAPQGAGAEPVLRYDPATKDFVPSQPAAPAQPIPSAMPAPNVPPGAVPKFSQAIGRGSRPIVPPGLRPPGAIPTRPQAPMMKIPGLPMPGEDPLAVQAQGEAEKAMQARQSLNDAMQKRQRGALLDKAKGWYQELQSIGSGKLSNMTPEGYADYYKKFSGLMQQLTPEEQAQVVPDTQAAAP
jgi:hypothetical protein